MAGPPYQRTLRLGHLAILPPSNLSNSPSPHHFQSFLVGLKYITSKQVLEVIYEDHQRFFVIASIMAKGSSKLHSVDTLSRGIENLSLVTQLWSVSWDTKVLLIENDSQEEVISKVECIWDYILYMNPFHLLSARDRNSEPPTQKQCLFVCWWFRQANFCDSGSPGDTSNSS